MKKKQNSKIMIVMLTTLMTGVVFFGFFTEITKAKTISVYDEKNSKIEFGVIRKYTLENEKAVKDKLIIKNTNTIPLIYEISIQEALNLGNNKLSAAYNTKRTKDFIAKDFFTFSVDNFMLQPSEERTIEIQIKKPDLNYLIPGDYLGAISITYSPAINISTSQTSGLSFRTRNIISFIITIPGKAIDNIRINKFKAKYINKTLKIEQTFENIGDTLIKITSKKILNEKKIGQKITESIVKNEILLPPKQKHLESFQKKIFTSLIKTINYKEEIKIYRYKSDSNEFIIINSFENKYEKTIINHFSLLIIILMICGLMGAMIRTGMKKKFILKKTVKYIVKRDDTLLSIQNKFNTSWKSIVKLNGLKAPYNLSEGKSIKIIPNLGTCKKNKKKLK